MITVSLSAVGSVIIALTVAVLVWLVICLLTLLVMFGDDKAFVVGPIVATIVVAVGLLAYFSMPFINFVP